MAYPWIDQSTLGMHTTVIVQVILQFLEKIISVLSGQTIRYDQRNRSRRLRRRSARNTEMLEFRQLLSASPVTLAAPDDVAVTSIDAFRPLTTAGPTGVTPQQIIQAYAFNQIQFSHGVTGDGSGTTIAIVDAFDDPNIAHDLHQFDVAFGLPDPQLTKVNENGGSALPIPNAVWITEIALDVEWAHAIAPKANILLVEANSNSMTDLMTAVNYSSHAPGVVVVSMSWGAGEFSAETSFDSLFTTPTGHPGVSFVVSSGDAGSPLSYPAASPNVLAVGGTSLYLSQGTYAGESGWSGSGGGISAYEAKPSYQNGTVTQSITQRTNPDVSYDANPSTGFPVYDSYNNGTATPWGQWGGTSAAAPQWAALIAIADQGRMLNGQSSLDGRTQLLPDIYQLPATDFHDVTSGTSTGHPVYSAGPGYDFVTGRGTPIANLVVSGLVGTPAIVAPSHFNLSAPSSVVSGQPFSITISAFSASNSLCSSYLGTVQFSTTDSMSGIVLPSSYTFTTSDNGVHTFTGIVLKTPGTASVLVRDSVTSTVSGSAVIAVSFTSSPPTLGGITSLNYVKNQSATAICPTIWLGDKESPTLVSATVRIQNAVISDDVLAFANTNPTLYGNIIGVFSSGSGTLTLTSSDATATVAQFQAALRAVTYFNESGNNAVLGTRTVSFQVSDGFQSSQPVASTIAVARDSTILGIAISSSTSTFGQSVQIVAAVNVAWPGQGIPTAGSGSGTVSFFDGSNLITGTVNYSVTNGRLFATLTTANLGLGSHSMTAVYTGDANFLGSTSVPLVVKIVPVSTTCVVTSSTVWPHFGDEMTLTAVVGTHNQSAVAPTAGAGLGSVIFRDGVNVIPGIVNYTTINGTLIATLITSSLSANLHLITAVYSGDAAFQQSIATPLKQVVLAAVSGATISSSTVSAMAGQAVTLTATIGVVGAGAGIPTTQANSVVFMDGAVPISGNVTYSIVNGKLVATLTTTNLKPGSHLIKVAYSGDANFSSCASRSLKLQILAP